MSRRSRPKYQVLISSTYADLHEERETVAWAILKSRHIPAGMENFSAHLDRGPWERPSPLSCPGGIGEIGGSGRNFVMRPVRIRQAPLLIAIAASVAACGFDARPKSGTVACRPQGDACCPEGYICVGRTASVDGTCWHKDDIPLTSLALTHDYTPAIANAPTCLVTDWLPSATGGASGTPDSGATPDLGWSLPAGTGGAPTDGGATEVVGGPVALDEFDPNTVYFSAFWDASLGIMGRARVFDSTNTDRFASSLTFGSMWGGIRPTDRALIYWVDGDFVVYQFVLDQETSKASPRDNDIEIPQPTCAPDKHIAPGELHIAPDSGDLLFICSPCGVSDAGCPTLYASGALGPSLHYGQRIMAIGYGGNYLIKDTELSVIASDGTAIPVPSVNGPDFAMTVAYRATPTGFWIAEEAGSDGFERWHVGYDGVVSDHRVYPPYPDVGAKMGTNPGPLAIDGQGRLIVARSAGTMAKYNIPREIIFRFDPDDAVGEVLVDPDSYGYLKLASIYTGP
jgi:hypothetical protein